MKHLPVEQLERSAEVHMGNPVRVPLSYRERLERWAEVLEREPDRRLNTLFEIEHLHRSKRGTLRCDGSPLSVAFEDPLLRAEGLESDTYGAAVRFFGLSEMEMHRITCYCMNGSSVSAETAARLVRSSRPFQAPGPLVRAVQWLWRRCGGATNDRPPVTA